MSTNFGSDNETRLYVLPYIPTPSGDYTWLSSASDSSGDWYIIFRRSISDVVTSGSVKLDTSIIINPPVVTDGPLSGATELWKGSLSWVALLDTGLTDQQLFDLANLTTTLLPIYQDDLIDLWDFSKPLESIPGLVSGQAALRYGDGYLTDNNDPLPYGSGELASIMVYNNGIPITKDGRILIAIRRV